MYFPAESFPSVLLLKGIGVFSVFRPTHFSFYLTSQNSEIFASSCMRNLKKVAFNWVHHVTPNYPGALSNEEEGQ